MSDRKNRDDTAPLLLDMDTAPAFLGIEKGALRGRVQRREIPIVKIGHRVFFDRQELKAWIRKCSRGPARTTR